MLLNERLLKLTTACSRTIQTTSAAYFFARGASPSMRERRINLGALCMISGKLARRGGRSHKREQVREGGLPPLQRSAFVGINVKVLQAMRDAGAGINRPVLLIQHQTQESHAGQAALAFRTQLEYKLRTNAKQESPQLQSQSPCNCPRHNARTRL